MELLKSFKIICQLFYYDVLFPDEIRYRRQFGKHPLVKLNGLSTPAVPFLFWMIKMALREVLTTNQKEVRCERAEKLSGLLWTTA